jgi:hypothetical protein
LGHFEDLELVHPDATKRTVPVGPQGFGSFCDLPHPVRCLYIPTRRDPKEAGTAVDITPVSYGDALIDLVRYSFSTRVLTALGLHVKRLNSLAQIAQQIPLRRLLYPSGLEYLPVVRDAILKDFRALRN